jgi:hypothetical protein
MLETSIAASRALGVPDMTRREANAALLGGAVLAVGPALAAENANAIVLPPPSSKGGKPLMEGSPFADRPVRIPIGRCRRKSFRICCGPRSASWEKGRLPLLCGFWTLRQEKVQGGRMMM